MKFVNLHQHQCSALSSLMPHDAPLKNGLKRRDFLKQSSVAVLLAGLLVHKPVVAKTLSSQVTANEMTPTSKAVHFTNAQKKILVAAQMQFFPDDGDGPSAVDIHALPYLQWALTDADNQADGDYAFIIKGLNDLNAEAQKLNQKSFDQLTDEQQIKVLKTIEQTPLGENWIGLMIYYLLEALLLDPIYGGNPDAIGWKWLEHQPGYPRPVKGHTYRDYIANPVRVKA